MYGVSMGLLEAALYGVPLAFVCDLFLVGRLGPVLAAMVGLFVWVAVGVWVMRRTNAKFSKSSSRNRPREDAAEVARNMQTRVLKHAAFASVALLIFATLPALFSPVFPSLGVWVRPSGIGFFCFTLLLGITTLYSLGGLVEKVRSHYPEYPGFTAAALFALGIVAFFAAYVLGV